MISHSLPPSIKLDIPEVDDAYAKNTPIKAAEPSHFYKTNTKFKSSKQAYNCSAVSHISHLQCQCCSQNSKFHTCFLQTLPKIQHHTISKIDLKLKKEPLAWLALL